MNQREALENLYSRYAADPVFKNLRKPGINLVPGKGPLNPDIMLIGESPGLEENANRTPFMGRAGSNLTRLLIHANIDPYKVFMTNVVKYWPRSEVEGRKRISREDNFTWEEADRSDDYLQEEIEIVAPKIIGLCGRFPIQAIFPDKDQIFRDHGLLLEGKYVPLYHPAVISYNDKKKDLLQEGYDKLKGYADNAEAIRR